MGLTICKKIIDENQGTIEVYSAGKDKGATFQFTMNMQEPGYRLGPVNRTGTKSSVKEVSGSIDIE